MFIEQFTVHFHLCSLQCSNWSETASQKLKSIRSKQQGGLSCTVVTTLLVVQTHFQNDASGLILTSRLLQQTVMASTGACSHSQAACRWLACGCPQQKAEVLINHHQV